MTLDTSIKPTSREQIVRDLLIEDIAELKTLTGTPQFQQDLAELENLLGQKGIIPRPSGLWFGALAYARANKPS